jgi:8-oxo-dGTP diphosphatase
VTLPRQTLCYVFRDQANGSRQVLLGRKLRGFGKGMIMAPGGHVEPGESDAQTAIREVYEESGLTIDPSSISHRAAITYLFPTKPSLDAQVAVFFGTNWTGTVTESDEMRPQWFSTDAPPLHEMWDDEQYWLPQVLAGEYVTAAFTFNDTGTKVIDADIKTVAPTDLA